METFINYTPIITGIWLIAMSMVMSTSNVLASMVFKIIPFFLGMSCLFAGSKLIGII